MSLPTVLSGVVESSNVLGNFQCRGVALIWIIVGHGPTVLSVDTGGGCLSYFLFFLSSFSARHRLKYCLKGP